MTGKQSPARLPCIRFLTCIRPGIAVPAIGPSLPFTYHQSTQINTIALNACQPSAIGVMKSDRHRHPLAKCMLQERAPRSLASVLTKLWGIDPVNAQFAWRSASIRLNPQRVTI